MILHLKNILSHQAECTHPSVADQACEQICTNTVGSFKCSCDRGWFLNGNGHSCDDLDECKCTNDPAYKDEKPECGDVSVLRSFQDYEIRVLF